MKRLAMLLPKILPMLPLFMSVSFGNCSWGQMRGVAASDCVTVQYISDVRVSMSGTAVAYLVKAPSLEEDRNDYQLYVRTLDDTTTSQGRLLFTGVDISDITWLEHDTRIAFLASTNSNRKLLTINVATGSLETLFEIPAASESFSMDLAGDVVVYTVSDGPLKNETAVDDLNSKERSHRVDLDEQGSSNTSTTSVFLRRRDTDGKWSDPHLLTFSNPFNQVKITHLVNADSLSLSPNGERLLLNYFADGIPEDWKKNSFVNLAAKQNDLLRIMILYDLRTGTTTLGFKTIYPDTVPLWSQDSRSFLMNAHSPIGSTWEAEDSRDHWTSPTNVNLFRVDVDSGDVSEVFRHVPPLYHHDGPLFWRSDGDVLVRKTWTTVARLHHFKDSWREVEDLSLPEKDEDRFRLVTSNGIDIVGVHETVSTAPDLFLFEPGKGQLRILTDLNPQLRTLKFAPIQVMHWTTADGLNLDGLLFMPVDYVPGKQYPLVIQTKGDLGFFTCDSGISHEPSFAPQPIASAGMMYLIRTVTANFDFQQEVDQRPKGYPGGIGEAVQAMDIWDSAVEALDKRGLIDSSKIGIIGFSRTGWHVEFDLVHARTKYAAATAADNVQYSLGEWWLLPWMRRDDEQMYGGPPFGDALKSWQQYSISYNFEKVHAPLLMEQMGYGVHDDIRGAFPSSLGSSYEVFNSLQRLGKPVELYYYPDEDHMPDHPRARFETEQRNVDWYRFWLQGYERPNPEDPDQYKRWEHLRELRDADKKNTVQMQSNTAKPD